MSNLSRNPRDQEGKYKNRNRGVKVSVTRAEVAKAIQDFVKQGGLILRLPDQPEQRRRRVQTGFWLASPYEEITFEELLQ